MTTIGVDEVRVDSPDQTVRFGQIELDLLATHAGVPIPFPLRVPSFGRIALERDVLLATAGQTLALRNLADADGPLGVAAEFVAALREHRGAVDLVLVNPAGSIGVVALVYRSWTLVCAQNLDDDPAATVLVRRVPETELADKLFAMVPRLAPVRSMPIRLPAQAVRTANRLIDDIADDTEKSRSLRELVREYGGDPAVLDDLAGLLPTLTGRGQLGATRRAGTGRMRAGTELSWLDGPRGRVRVSRDTDGWVSVNPLRPMEFRSALDELAAIARQQ